MLLRPVLSTIFIFVSVLCSAAQGLIISEMQCQTTYRGIPFQGVFQVQVHIYSGSTGDGYSVDRSQLNWMLKEGRASEIPGTLVLMGEFTAPGVVVHVEAPNIVGGQGTGGIVVNGQIHRATYATFYLVAGGVVALTEDRERIEYACR